MKEVTTPYLMIACFLAHMFFSSCHANKDTSKSASIYQQKDTSLNGLYSGLEEMCRTDSTGKKDCYTQQKMELEKGKPVRINFEKCDDENCMARIINGYASNDDGTQQDIFQKFLDFDHVLFLFIYSDGSHKSVAVPLFSFKKQYKNLDQAEDK